jgi:hypothetical protein
MCGNKRPLIGRRELQDLVASRDAFLADRFPIENDVVESTGLTPLPSPHSSQMTSLAIRPTVGQLSLPAGNRSVAVIPGVNGRPLVADDGMNFGAVSILAGNNAIEGREFNPFMHHVHHTRRVARYHRALYLQQKKLKDFNTRFRALPVEIRDIIFGFALEWDGKKAPKLIVGLRTTREDPDVVFYKAALSIFYSRFTYRLSRKNSWTMDPLREDAMLPVVWETVRNLEIKHE